MKLAIAILTLAVVIAHAAVAASFTWDGGGLDNNWTTAGNWNPDGAPVNNGTADIHMAGSVRTSPSVSVPWSINSLVFNSGAAAFTIGGMQLTIGSGGVTNNTVNQQTINDAIVLGGNQTWNAGAGSLVFGGTLNNAGLTLTTQGSVTISGTISGAGTSGLIVNGGTTVLSAPATDQFVGTTVNDGMLELAIGQGLTTTQLVIGDSVGTTQSAIAKWDFSSELNSAGTTPVTIFGDGLMNLNGNNQAIGSLAFSQGGAVNTGTGTLTMNGNISTTGGNTAVIFGNLDLGGTTRTIATTASDKLTIFANISNGAIDKTSLGTLELSGTNTYAGGLIADAGLVVLGSDTAAGTGGSLALNGAQIFAENGLRTINNNILIGNNTTFGNIDGSNFAFGGFVTLTGNRTITVGTSGMTITFAGAIGQDAAGRTLTIGPGINGTFVMSGSGSNTYTGTTTVNTGTLQLAKTGGALAIQGPVVIGDGTGTDTVQFLASNQLKTTSTVTLNNSGVLDLNGFSQSLSSNSALTFTGGAVTTGGGTLSFSNQAFITNNANATAATISGNLMFHNFQLDGQADTLTVADGAAAVDLDISANILDNGGTNFFIKNGAGTLRLSGNNTFGGGGTLGFELLGGTLAIGSNTALGSSTSPLHLDGGTLLSDTSAHSLSNAVVLEGDTIIGGSQGLSFSGSLTERSGTHVLTVNNTGVTSFGSLVIGQNDGLTIAGSGAVTISNSSNISGPLSVTGSSALSFNAGAALTLTSTSSFTLATTASFNGNLTNFGAVTMGGSFLGGTLTNQGSFVYNGGTFSGRLVNQGSATFNADFTAGNGLANFVSMSISAGHTLTLNGQGFDNEGTFTLAGGTLTGTGQLVNNGLLTGAGTIAGSGGFINNAQWTIATTNVAITNSGANSNAGNIDISSGLQLQLSGASMSNSGSINLNGGTVAGAALLTNSAGGVISGHGLISAGFSNSGGTIQPSGGTLNIPASFTNTGLIKLTNGAALAGGTITNPGRIQGDGTVGNPINNTGRIEGIGTLALAGALTNAGAGLITASTGNNVVALSGLTTNSAAINLTGGSFDNNGHTLNNTGFISGYGNFSTGGLTNNGGTAASAGITFTGGTSTINGDVTNAASKRIEVKYNPAIFTGNVTNNGIFKTTSTTVTFAGTFTNNGTFSSDPATQSFQNLSIGSSGALQGGAGDVFVINGNLINNSTQRFSFDIRGAQLSLSGSAHDVAWTGADLGAVAAGFENNFAIGMFELNSGNTLTLLDGNNIAGGALYVHAFKLDGGLAQLGSIESNGISIYYDGADPNNAYLNGQTYQLDGGGNLAPVNVPEPSSLTLGAIALLTIAALRLRRRTN